MLSETKMINDEYPLTPVPKARLRHWFSVAAISALVSLSLPTFLTGIEVGQSLSFDQTLAAIYLGSLILTLVGGVSGTLGVKYRLTSYALIQASFGGVGARIVNLAFGASLVGWFGVNVDLFSDACIQLLGNESPHSAQILLIEICAGVIMTISTLLGFLWINRLSMLFAPVLLVVTAFLMNLWIRGDSDLAYAKISSELSFSNAVSAVVGAAIIGAVILPDITRYVTQSYGGWMVSIVCYLVIAPPVMLIAAGAMSHSEAKELLDLMMISGLGLGAALIVILGSWVLNSLNLYSAVLSIRASVPVTTTSKATVGLGLLGICAATLDITSWFIDFLIYLSIGFIPVAAIMLVHFQSRPSTTQCIEGLVLTAKTNNRALLIWAMSMVMAMLELEFNLSVSGVLALDLLVFSALTYAMVRPR